MGKGVLNKRSSVVINGVPKAPDASALTYGEIAVNFSDGHERLFIKNNSNEIISFSTDEAYDQRIGTIETIVGAHTSSITDLDEEKADTYTINCATSSSVTFDVLNEVISTISGGGIVYVKGAYLNNLLTQAGFYVLNSDTNFRAIVTSASNDGDAHGNFNAIGGDDYGVFFTLAYLLDDGEDGVYTVQRIQPKLNFATDQDIDNLF